MKQYKMNEIINKYLLTRDTFMTKTHLKRYRFTLVLMDLLLRTKQKYIKLKKQEIQDIFFKTR